MTPGSLLLGNAGQVFECGHEHGTGDRCLAFHYAPHYFERLAAGTGLSKARISFHILRLPPLRELAPLISRACAGLNRPSSAPWEELSIQLAAQTLQLAAGLPSHSREAPPGAEARVARTVRMIETHSAAEITLDNMAREACLSPYYFLRTFQLLTGVTPHQYVIRHRLRNAATRLAIRRDLKPASILDIALDCGFGDVSNFNRTFRAEFGVSPRAWCKQHA
jgi:AraC-like DNA-binding protein